LNRIVFFQISLTSILAVIPMISCSTATVDNTMSQADRLCCPVVVKQRSPKFAFLYGTRTYVPLYSTEAFSQTFIEIECATLPESENPRLSGSSETGFCNGSCRQNVEAQLAITVGPEFYQLKLVEINRGCNFICADEENCSSRLRNRKSSMSFKKRQM